MFEYIKRHTPPLFSELTISFLEMDNSIMSLLFSDVCEPKNILIKRHSSVELVEYTPPLLQGLSCFSYSDKDTQ